MTRKIKETVDCYVVRIYRRTAKEDNPIAGTVEKVGKENKYAFSNQKELWDFLRIEQKMQK